MWVGQIKKCLKTSLGQGLIQLSNTAGLKMYKKLVPGAFLENVNVPNVDPN